MPSATNQPQQKGQRQPSDLSHSAARSHDELQRHVRQQVVRSCPRAPPRAAAAPWRGARACAAPAARRGRRRRRVLRLVDEHQPARRERERSAEQHAARSQRRSPAGGDGGFPASPASAATGGGGGGAGPPAPAAEEAARRREGNACVRRADDARGPRRRGAESAPPPGLLPLPHPVRAHREQQRRRAPPRCQLLSPSHRLPSRAPPSPRRRDERRARNCDSRARGGGRVGCTARRRQSRAASGLSSMRGCGGDELLVELSTRTSRRAHTQKLAIPRGANEAPGPRQPRRRAEAQEGRAGWQRHGRTVWRKPEQPEPQKKPMASPAVAIPKPVAARRRRRQEGKAATAAAAFKERQGGGARYETAGAGARLGRLAVVRLRRAPLNRRAGRRDGARAPLLGLPPGTTELQLQRELAAAAPLQLQLLRDWSTGEPRRAARRRRVAERGGRAAGGRRVARVRRRRVGGGGARLGASVSAAMRVQLEQPRRASAALASTGGAPARPRFWRTCCSAARRATAERAVAEFVRTAGSASSRRRQRSSRARSSATAAPTAASCGAAACAGCRCRGGGGAAAEVVGAARLVGDARRQAARRDGGQLVQARAVDEGVVEVEQQAGRALRLQGGHGRGTPRRCGGATPSSGPPPRADDARRPVVPLDLGAVQQELPRLAPPRRQGRVVPGGDRLRRVHRRRAPRPRPEGALDVDTRGRFVRFDGRYEHEVLPYEGTRYSVIYFQLEPE